MAPTETSSSLENDARNLAISLEKHQFAILIVLTLVYAIGAVANARAKPLWYDEIVTMFAAGAKDPGMTWFLAQQTDINPPLPHLLVHFTTRWVGNLEIGARIPAIAGFWVLCLCLYRFTRRRVGMWFALAALLIPVVTRAYQYALEARAYGPLLGFCGIALIGWQAAVDGRKRIPGLAALSVGLAGALMCHYYVILIYLPLAGAEAFRCYRRRRLDWGICAAFAAGATPLLLLAASIRGAGRWSTHSWAQPSPQQILEFWETGLQQSLSFLVLLLALLAMAILAGRKKTAVTPGVKIALQDHELVAGVLFLAIPVVAVAGALLVTHVFTPRYALFALVGFAFLAPMVIAELSRGSALTGFLFVVALLPGLALMILERPALQSPFAQEPVLAKALQTGPVIVSDGQLFLQAWQYAPEQLRSRLVFVADCDAAVKYLGFDSIDGGMLMVRPWAPATVTVVDYRAFYVPGKEFLVYQNTMRPDWLVTKTVEEGGSATVLAYRGFRQLVRVQFKR